MRSWRSVWSARFRFSSYPLWVAASGLLDGGPVGLGPKVEDRISRDMDMSVDASLRVFFWSIKGRDHVVGDVVRIREARRRRFQGGLQENVKASLVGCVRETRRDGSMH